MLLSHRQLNEWETKLKDMSSKEFDSYMCKPYTNMFALRNYKSGVVLPMNFGFEIGPGWRHILDSLCNKLQFLEGYGVVCVFDQIKEKYGSGRFYYHLVIKDDSAGPDDVRWAMNVAEPLVHHYESYTEYVCEELGTNVYPEDKVSTGSWFYGMGIEGFKEYTTKQLKDTPELIEERVQMVENCLAIQKRVKKVHDNMYYFSDEQIQIVEDIVERMKRENSFDKKDK